MKARIDRQYAIINIDSGIYRGLMCCVLAYHCDGNGRKRCQDMADAVSAKTKEYLARYEEAASFAIEDHVKESIGTVPHLLVRSYKDYATNFVVWCFYLYLKDLGYGKKRFARMSEKVKNYLLLSLEAPQKIEKMYEKFGIEIE